MRWRKPATHPENVVLAPASRPDDEDVHNHNELDVDREVLGYGLAKTVAERERRRV